MDAAGRADGRGSAGLRPLIAVDDLDVLIVGAGPAGLAAAKFVADAGRSALVLEKRDVAGGKLSSWRDADGDRLASAVHVVGGHVGALAWALPPGFSPRSGATEADFETLRFEGGSASVRAARAVAATSRFSALEKLQFARGILPALSGGPAYALRQDDVTFAAWHRARGMSEHVLRAFFAPLSLALAYTPVDRVSAGALLRALAFLAASTDAKRADRDGAVAFAESLVAGVRARDRPARLSSTVDALIFEGDRVAGVRTRDGRDYRAEATILATPVHEAARLLPPAMLRDPLVHGVGALTSCPAIAAHLWFDRDVSRFAVPVVAAGTLLPLHVASGGAADAGARPGTSHVRAVVAPADDLVARDDAAVVERIMTDMAKLYPLATRRSLVKAKLVRIPKSVYRASPGAERLRPGARTPVRNLFLAGDYTNHRLHASIEGAVRSAKTAVEEALEQIGVRA